MDLPGVPLPTATKLDDWLDRLRAAVRRHTMYKQAWDALGSRIPVFVYYSQYFTVRPRIHLANLARPERDGGLPGGRKGVADPARRTPVQTELNAASAPITQLISIVRGDGHPLRPVQPRSRGMRRDLEPAQPLVTDRPRRAAYRARLPDRRGHGRSRACGSLRHARNRTPIRTRSDSCASTSHRSPSSTNPAHVSASGQTSWYPPSTARGTWEPPPSRSSSPSPRNKAACGRVTQWHCSAWPPAPVPA